jgi:4-hydroxy-tetrahydrodipicolinate reductase
MLRILMNGCGGRMGRVITNLTKDMPEAEVVAGCDIKPPDSSSFPVYKNIGDCTDIVDVVIDFSHPSAFSDVTSFCAGRRIPLVMATTGLSKEQVNELSIIARRTAVFFSANMSMGINLLMELAKTAASFTEGLFDIEIVEKHHNSKIDAPSGTALAIADGINSALETPKTHVYDRTGYRKSRKSGEIGIHAVRGGTIVGEHTVILAGRDEVIEIKHEAMSRDIFASGAIKAALFIQGKPAGLYSMQDIINSD